MTAKADLIASLRAEMEAITREGAAAPSRAQDVPADEGRSAVEGASVAVPRSARGQRASMAGTRRGVEVRDAGEADARNEPEGVDSELTAERAFRKILRLATAREQSTVRLRARLLRDGYADDVAQEAIARAVRAHAVDDRRYAEALVRMRLASGKGVEGVIPEIEELGIDPEVLDSLAEYRAGGEETDVERALSLLARRPPRAKNQRDAAFRKLVQQGFGSSTAAAAARRWAEGR